MLSKKNIFQEVISQLQERQTLLEEETHRLAESKAADTKSSAGDKFETGREMISQELAKVEASLRQAKGQINALSHLSKLEISSKIKEGSLVLLGEKWLLLSVSLGEMKIGSDSVFLLSKESPMGKNLLGKVKGDSVQFMGKPNRIEELL